MMMMILMMAATKSSSFLKMIDVEQGTYTQTNAIAACLLVQEKFANARSNTYTTAVVTCVLMPQAPMPRWMRK